MLVSLLSRSLSLSLSLSLERRHFRRSNLVLSYLLLDSELLIGLVFLFATYIGNTCFLILVYVENLPIHGRTLDLVRRERRVESAVALAFVVCVHGSLPP